MPDDVPRPAPGPWSLDGKVALITGAGAEDGIGFAAASLLGRLGASVRLVGLSERVRERAAELGRAGIDAKGLAADLTDSDRAAEAVRWASEGGLHIVVNNAGMVSVAQSDAQESGRPGDVPDAAWRAGLARNLDTAFYVTRAALPSLQASRWGRIVMVASVTGPVMAMHGEAAYAAAKAGMVGLARSIAVDYAAEAITCNVVAPGWIATGSQLPREAAAGRATPAGRSGTPDEVAFAIAALVAPGSSYLTGQVVVVDGGNSISEERG